MINGSCDSKIDFGKFTLVITGVMIKKAFFFDYIFQVVCQF
ncbi:hypothetical protein SAMN05444955_10512 [Lihuaxuella thermophila]|uniref:Uncharacterized protein n=1 Tax=Lihuaxuella thermophila TaxID=1173111 RepID=A0A1H8D7R8_9BACL|nr:hypothetical protein SAMN05444955_10512 [Lihuaxuella thermophila]